MSYIKIHYRLYNVLNWHVLLSSGGTRCSSWCDYILVSMLHGGPIEQLLFQPVLHDWCNKGRGM